MVRPIHDILAPELISMILSLLDRHELARTSIVSRLFHALSLRYLYSSLVFRPPPTPSNDASHPSPVVNRSTKPDPFRQRRERLLRALSPSTVTTAQGTRGRLDPLQQSEVQLSAYVRSIHAIDYHDFEEQWLDLARLVKNAPALKQVVMTKKVVSQAEDSEEDQIDLESFWTELQRSESLNALTLVMGPSIPLGLDKFSNLTHLSIKSYSIDNLNDGSLPLTLTHLSLEYVHDFDASFVPPPLFANLCSLSLKNVPREVLVIITNAIQTFSSQTPRPISPLRKLILDAFPHGFACLSLTDHTWVPHIFPLFVALSPPTYSSLVDLELLSTPAASREYVLDARTLLHGLHAWFPRLERLVFTIGAGDEFIDAYDMSAPSTRATTSSADYALWLGSFSEFKALRSLTHNILFRTPAAIRTACSETFTLIPTLDTLAVRTSTKKAFDFGKVIIEDEIGVRKVEGGCKVKTVIHYGSLGMTEQEARRRWPEAKLAT
ncbi:BQ2448_7481 [Microbotryum intermedium]|uniref:BQ2448_7481 protein n=1 Tax=Microbotryum intermedium TaxID=269621 RepID=A0A238FK80_9BASI|nr:BQ2448_7481 [Microbotryum intermedium]